mgnify:CR=1 FL=1
MKLVIIPQGRKAVGIVEEIIEETMGSYHAYYARIALETGIARALITYLNREPIAIEVYYIVSPGIKILIHYYIAVKPQYQHKHVAKMLIASTEYLHENQVEALIATSTLDNKPARKMFTSLQYHEYTWERLAEEIGYENTYTLIQTACAHEDDLIFIKPAQTSIQQLMNRLQKLELRTPWKTWNKICYKPWLRLYLKT